MCGVCVSARYPTTSLAARSHSEHAKAALPSASSHSISGSHGSQQWRLPRRRRFVLYCGLSNAANKFSSNIHEHTECMHIHTSYTHSSLSSSSCTRLTFRFCTQNCQVRVDLFVDELISFFFFLLLFIFWWRMWAGRRMLEWILARLWCLWWWFLCAQFFVCGTRTQNEEDDNDDDDDGARHTDVTGSRDGSRSSSGWEQMVCHNKQIIVFWSCTRVSSGASLDCVETIWKSKGIYMLRWRRWNAGIEWGSSICRIIGVFLFFSLPSIKYYQAMTSSEHTCWACGTKYICWMGFSESSLSHILRCMVYGSPLTITDKPLEVSHAVKNKRM